MLQFGGQRSGSSLFLLCRNIARRYFRHNKKSILRSVAQKWVKRKKPREDRFCEEEQASDDSENRWEGDMEDDTAAA